MLFALFNRFVKKWWDIERVGTTSVNYPLITLMHSKVLHINVVKLTTHRINNLKINFIK